MVKKKGGGGGNSFLEKKVSNRLSYTIIAAFALVFIGVFVLAVAPNPGHDANQVGPGTFAAGDYVFSGTSKVGIGTSPATNEVLAVNPASGKGARIGPTGNDGSTALLLTSTTATQVPLIVRGASSQTAPLLKVQDGTNADKLFITASGNVGIGTTSPGAYLHINKTGPSGGMIYLENSGSGGKKWGILARGTGYDPVGGFSIKDETAGVDRFVIDASGNIGIGTTSPTTGGGWGPVVEISGGPALIFNNTMVPRSYRLAVDNSGYFIIYDTTDNIKRIFISPNGNVAIGDIDPISNPLTQKLVVYGGILLRDTGIVSFLGESCSNADRGTLVFDKNQGAGDDVLYVCVKYQGGNSWMPVNFIL